MPANSYGYNLQIETESDVYEFWASAEWDGFNYCGKGSGGNSCPSNLAYDMAPSLPTLDRFIAATTSNSPQSKASCRIAFHIEKVSATTGKFHWAFDRDASCSNAYQMSWNFTEQTDYVIKNIAGKEVMEVFVPSLYRAAKPGEMVANSKFAFAVVNRPVLKAGKSPYSMDPNDYEMPTTPLPGIYSGEFSPASTKGVYEFTGNLGASGQFLSRVAAEHLAKQRGMTLDGLVPTK
jgi:hypothetical protein